jgi:hypothetical protein
MVTDRQVRRLLSQLAADSTLCNAAMRSGMDEKTARKYRDLGLFPSELGSGPRTWRTRPDPFAAVWDEVAEQLKQAPGLQAKTLLKWLQERRPGQFEDGQLRSLQRRVREWQAMFGPAKEVFFSQVHHPGRLGASDFTHMTDLGVTLAGQPFAHLLYHFVLTYSNWETVSICFSESFESLSEGLQRAFWELGGVPERHRTDRMSAAVNNLSDQRSFTRRYQALMDHYGLQVEKTQAGHGNENGDVEQSHRRFKEAVDQALLLRGHRDFRDREEYAGFLRGMLDERNAGRRSRKAEELALLRPLPARRLESYSRRRVRVDTGTLIHVERNVYSVHSRLIGEWVEVRLHAEEVEVWYRDQVVERTPRLRGRQKHHVNYRHVIDWLSRKPGAFENYRYREDLFPTSRFRMAYDTLRDSAPASASRTYLQILLLAARENESAVDDALRMLLAEDRVLTFEAVQEWIGRRDAVRPITEVRVEAAELSSFDTLFEHKEVWDGFGDGAEAAAGGVPAGAALAGVS